jgi:hypothetical protein
MSWLQKSNLRAPSNAALSQNEMETLVRFDSSRPDHLAPPLGFVCAELSKVGDLAYRDMVPLDSPTNCDVVGLADHRQ